MKKISLLLMLLVLFGCKEEVVLIKTQEPEEEMVKIETKEVVIPSAALFIIEDVVKQCNQLINIIEIETLHEKMITDLLSSIDTKKDLDLQEDLLKEVVLFHLKSWREEIVETSLETLEVTVHEDDYALIISRVSIVDVYQIMVAYEKIYLRKYE